MKTARLTGIIAVFVISLSLSGQLWATRLKDIAGIQGMRTNKLYGYGLVVGLKRTGDGTQAKFTIQSIANMLERMGVNFDPNSVQVKNAAAVMVTAELPPFAKNGQKIDVNVASIGDAKSLQGGTLVLTPLKGPDGNIYALAQGPLLLGGYSASGGGSSTTKNHPTAGRIPNGATVEREIPLDFNARDHLHISLFRPDFTTVSRAVEAINDTLSGDFASAVDAETIRVNMPVEYQGNAVGLMAAIENVNIGQEQCARVVMDERTGTVVMGKDVRISTVAIAHGNLSINIRENPEVSQPGAFSRGQTVVTNQAEVTAREEGGEMVVLKSGASIGELVGALNAVGVTPRDLISIIQSIKTAGALQADLEVI
jgi:flagellar P-ring protein precursor FlgI